ncbi:unnamed protein product (mitochondrion) [Plasmodiophora brassicae]|uniref:Uncharacterized protein n=1 Tax=Plasmodiophora brassicae TaxID=37360 RepID=A0A3P3Y4M0_PLABS|nr:unnamed protein product [Plasmodiophora brassicae]
MHCRRAYPSGNTSSDYYRQYLNTTESMIFVAYPDNGKYWMRFEFDVPPQGDPVPPGIMIGFRQFLGGARRVTVSFEYKQCEYVVYSNLPVDRSFNEHAIYIRRNDVLKSVYQTSAETKSCKLLAESKLSEKRRLVTEQSSTIERLEEESSKQKHALETVKDERSSLRANVTSQARLITRLTGQVTLLDGERALLRNDSIRQASEIANLSERLLTLNDEGACLRQKLACVLAKLTRQANETAKLNDLLSTLRQERACLLANSTNQAIDIANLNDQITVLERERTMLLASSTRQAAEIANLNTHVVEVEGERACLREERSRLIANGTCQANVIETLNKCVLALQEERKDFLAKGARQACVLANLTRQANEIAKLNDLLSALRQEHACLLANATNQATDISNLNDQVTVLERERTMLLASSTRQAAEIANLNTHVVKMEGERACLREERSRLLANGTRMANVIATLNSRVLALQDERKDFVAKGAREANHIANLNIKVTELEGQGVCLREECNRSLVNATRLAAQVATLNLQTKRLAAGMIAPIGVAVAMGLLAARLSRPVPTDDQNKRQAASKSLLVASLASMAAGIGLGARYVASPAEPAPSGDQPLLKSKPLPRLYVAPEYRLPIMAGAVTVALAVLLMTLAVVYDCSSRRRVPDHDVFHV